MKGAFAAVVAAFFLCGFSATLNDSLIPYLQDELGLCYSQIMTIPLSFYLAYFTVCPAAGAYVARVGAKRGLVSGMVLGGAGSFAILAGIAWAVYFLVLMGVFVLGAGVSLLQVTGNPLAVLSGSETNSHARLIFAQAFTGVGMVLAPWLASNYLRPDQRFHSIYAVLGWSWLALAAAVYLLPLPDALRRRQISHAKERVYLLSSPHFMLCFAALFAYVGLEVGIGGFLVKFLTREEVGRLSMGSASRYCSLYWAGLFLGRFVGSRSIRALDPSTLLLVHGLGGMAMMAMATLGGGAVALWGAVLAGLCNSIIFPTIFAMGLRGTERFQAEASGILCMANLGGAVLPLLQGVVADLAGIQPSFAVPFFGYLAIVFFALFQIKPIGEMFHDPYLRR